MGDDDSPKEASIMRLSTAISAKPSSSISLPDHDQTPTSFPSEDDSIQPFSDKRYSEKMDVSASTTTTTKATHSDKMDVSASTTTTTKATRRQSAEINAVILSYAWKPSKKQDDSAGEGNSPQACRPSGVLLENTNILDAPCDQNKAVKEKKTGEKTSSPNIDLSCEKILHDVPGKADNSKPEQTTKTRFASFFKQNAFMVTLLCNAMLEGLLGAVLHQYNYRFFHSQHEEELSRFNVSRECGVQLSPEVQDIENRISEATARWSMYKQYVTIIPNVIASLLLGLKSDQIGRRFVFLFPFFTSMLTCVVDAVVIRLNLHFGFTLIGDFAYSMSGGNISMAFAADALISDSHGKKPQSVEIPKLSQDVHRIHHRQQQDQQQQQQQQQEAALEEANTVTDLDMTREKERAFKIVVIDILTRLSHSIIAFATGYIIQYAGFFYTLVLVMGLKMLVFLYTLRFVQESGQQKKSPGFIEPLRTIRRATSDRWTRLTLVLVMAGQLTAGLGYNNEFSVLTTYQMSPPFCFSSIQLGYFASEHRAKAVFGIPLMVLWQKLQVSESSIAAIACFFESVSVFMIAVIRHAWVFYVAQIVSIPGALSTSMAKAICSRLIGRSALASTFALMLVIQEVNGFVGGLVSNHLYQSTLDTVPTACFFMASVAFLLSASFFLSQTCRQRCHTVKG